MKIGVIQASTRADINDVFVQAVQQSVAGQHEVVNLGVFSSEIASYSYVEVAVMISFLIESQSLDFVVTGCSAGQGMMLACNSLPGLRCGFIQTPQDAFLFGRINNGNVVSLPLGLNVGWCGELNLKYTLEKLFDGEFGVGYPQEDATRKQQETALLNSINQLTKKTFLEIVDEMDEALLRKIANRTIFYQYVDRNAKNRALVEKLRGFRN
ncbi:RpiB/LacA/LacB family sugar-phosphate isomerase [Streptococcus cuniculi]|uniref:4-deoxy-L-threo-5-hexosulose-uronate ketol-isomerase n=1 Tax=Streptococcus cuniculi TaxID=1432788 RepID=A0A4Y9JB83_9STRE|nr:RpiB/LacA/LacB family sugar-phosphate isomerase [Streptococcus cuniculi]MBF0778309.1 RpiB/LacA/LacB family sugar-phosphate isomerase [Streptococcus cuniculi]TFU97801.1 4-deoxy-L-threo-5-hexosulose-uronate ketol-isomerase [Streptococcus cuniculi]